MSSFTFTIVGKRDNPLYEFVHSPKKEDAAQNQQNQFFVHAALDVVDEEMWKTSSMFLKSVDKFNDRVISAYVTATHIRFMLLHDGKSEEAVRSFFNEVHEIYIKVLANPFCNKDEPITSPAFDARVRALARKYL
mmetsp:Transcript_5397/g.13725  ORF Transcript_5397/g.13725 Transcript_5397/m.13725 type:complete len:135 (-) Transcript_5397:702-1106(-)